MSTKVCNRCARRDHKTANCFTTRLPIPDHCWCRGVGEDCCDGGEEFAGRLEAHLAKCLHLRRAFAWIVTYKSKSSMKFLDEILLPGLEETSLKDMIEDLRKLAAKGVTCAPSNPERRATAALVLAAFNDELDVEGELEDISEADTSRSSSLIASFLADRAEKTGSPTASVRQAMATPLPATPVLIENDEDCSSIEEPVPRPSSPAPAAAQPQDRQSRRIATVKIDRPTFEPQACPDTIAFAQFEERMLSWLHHAGCIDEAERRMVLHSALPRDAANMIGWNAAMSFDVGMAELRRAYCPRFDGGDRDVHRALCAVPVHGRPVRAVVADLRALLTVAHRALPSCHVTAAWAIGDCIIRHMDNAFRHWLIQAKHSATNEAWTFPVFLAAYERALLMASESQCEQDYTRMPSAPAQLFQVTTTGTGQHRQTHQGRRGRRDPRHTTCTSCHGSDVHARAFCPKVQCYACRAMGHMAMVCQDQQQRQRVGPAGNADAARPNSQSETSGSDNKH